MERYWNYTRQYASASPAGGATVEVRLAGTATLATIYADNLDPATPKANPFLADADGFFYFYAAAGRYDVRLSGTGITSPYTWSDVLLLADYDVAMLGEANTFTGNQTVDGDLIVTGAGTFGTPAVSLIGSDGRLAGLTSAYVANLSGADLTTLNASNLASGTLPNARLAGTYGSAVTLSNTANVLAGTSLALGATPSSTGALRVTFNEGLVSRNQGNSGDVVLLRLSTGDYAVLTNANALNFQPLADDTYNLGATDHRWRNAHVKDLYTTGFLGVGTAADQAGAGAIRLVNGTSGQIAWRNAVGSADAGEIYVNTSDELYLHFPKTVLNDVWPDSDGDEWIGDSTMRFDGAFFATGGVHIGDAPAQSGGLRLDNAMKIVGRNASDNADVDVLAVDAGNLVRIYTQIRYHGPQSTGGGTAALSTNCPANTPTAPYTWFQFTSSDGSVVYVPAWK